MNWAATSKVKRILIANRGEIACRVIRTAKKMGLETVAVYSDADNSAMHVSQADRAFYLGSSAASESYLKSDRILNIAEQADVDMIHPGYGFLSENATFAQACTEKKIQFIGPPAAAIRAMGSKSKAKEIMAQAGVPLIPGYHSADQSDQRLFQEAQAIGYPLLIKAVSGGGGKGMRVIHCADDFAEGVASARREAGASFGDTSLLLESYLINTRHVEVQIFFDRHGQSVFLFDRDCSLQRRHQKIIEESPAPGLADSTRKAMGEAALTAGRTIGYEGAGTVEFLLSGDDFYFMEVNTRLQVEHPVTELITGIDMVEWQIRVANGEKLPLEQDKLNYNGHAIEARIYAEDPDNDFLPSAGRLFYFGLPKQNEDVRIDSGVQQGDVVSSWYDPMLAKVIAWGENRNQAINKLTEALAETHQVGLIDNRDYLLSLLQHSEFLKGNVHTEFTNDYCHRIGNNSVNTHLLAVAALYRYHTEHYQSSSVPILGNNTFPMYFYFGEKEYCVRVSPIGEQFRINFVDGSWQGRIEWQKEELGLSGFVHTEHEVLPCRVVPFPVSKIKVFLSDCSQVIGLPGCQSEQHQTSDKSLTAPMTGTVTAINVSPGQSVDIGFLLLTMEAMKMEYSIKAPKKGIIESVYFTKGDQVESGAELISYKDAADATV
ncbi:MAG: biotin carboxylase N-terminal domain-containing protein [Candidatus Endonucleobacter sp. (ex Gigantidas childressi)]|nr:biotin carboxylase N-terminal domain-containing protein [Candidatus Endonucleobacter sp. (ex Gigantidas childressi)]